MILICSSGSSEKKSTRFYKVHAACQVKELTACLMAVSLSIVLHHCGLSPNSPLTNDCCGHSDK